DYPGRFAIMGSLPLDQPGSRARIAGWRQQPDMLGLRYIFLRDPARRWLADGTIDWLWAEAEEAGVPIAVLATDSFVEIARIAERHPGLRLTIAHLGGRGGLTTLKDHAAMVHMPSLLALARFQNVAVNATGAPGYSAEAYPFPIMQTYLRHIYDAFGPHRMFWGTVISAMPCSWRQCVTMFTEELSWLGGAGKPLVMGGALCAWSGWKRGRTEKGSVRWGAQRRVWASAGRANEQHGPEAQRLWPSHKEDRYDNDQKDSGDWACGFGRRLGARRLGRQGRDRAGHRAGQVHAASTRRACVLRVQGIRRLADGGHQP